MCGSFSFKHIGIKSIPPSALKSTDLPSITGEPAEGPILPRPKMAVPLVIIAA